MQIILTKDQLNRKLKLAREEGYERGYSQAFNFIKELIRNPEAPWRYGERFQFAEEVRFLSEALKVYLKK